jgi:Uncharacterized conserved protein, contains FHA domain
MFCGECGRAVVTTTPTTVRTIVPRPLTRPVAVAEENHCEQCGAEMAPGDIFCGECGFVSRSVNRAFTGPRDTNVVERLEQVEQDGPEPAIEDVEPTRIITRKSEGERFVLQFSTGESFTVFGSGLIGRNPRPEPGEYFDQLVRVLDPSRSVSKTHLEFGQEAGGFWVKDRFSGNGTIVREPDTKPLRCHPDRRYRLVRGSRVDMGEQFFIVS